MRRSLCRGLTIVFALLYGLALLIWTMGSQGLFGTDPDPVWVAVLLPLGMPWIMAVDLFPDPAWPALAAASPALSLVLLVWICRRFD